MFALQEFVERVPRDVARGQRVSIVEKEEGRHRTGEGGHRRTKEEDEEIQRCLKFPSLPPNSWSMLIGACGRALLRVMSAAKTTSPNRDNEADKEKDAESEETSHQEEIFRLRLQGLKKVRCKREAVLFRETTKRSRHPPTLNRRKPTSRNSTAIFSSTRSSTSGS
jgi:hypothetical protein